MKNALCTYLCIRWEVLLCNTKFRIFAFIQRLPTQKFHSTSCCNVPKTIAQCLLVVRVYAEWICTVSVLSCVYFPHDTCARCVCVCVCVMCRAQVGPEIFLIQTTMRPLFKINISSDGVRECVRWISFSSSFHHPESFVIRHSVIPNSPSYVGMPSLHLVKGSPVYLPIYLEPFLKYRYLPSSLLIL